MRQTLVLVPGVQGRPEYLQPATDALSGDFDVTTFPLCGERGCETKEASADFDAYASLVRAALDRRGVARAIVCGVSFGGLVALHFAATDPERTEALVLASTPGPGWHLRRRHEVYSRVPWLFGPLFLAEAPLRLRPEIMKALPDARARRRFVAWQLRTLVAAPLSLTRMAARARLIASFDVEADCRRVAAPTLVVTGEPELDRAVQAERTRDYLRLIPHSTGVVLEDTGHLGSLTRPHAFAKLIRDFVTTRGGQTSERRSA